MKNGQNTKKHSRILVAVIAVVLIVLIAGISLFVNEGSNDTDETELTETTETMESEELAALRLSLLDENVTTVEITGTITVRSTLQVVGTKTITGGGTLIASESEDGEPYYILTLTDGADVTFEEVTINGNNIAGGIHVEEGAGTTLCSGLKVLYASSERANVLVEGEGTLDGGSLFYAGGNNVINRGAMEIKDGEITGSGVFYQYAGILNTGDLTMTGGKVDSARTNVIVGSGGIFTFEAGEITDAAADGISVEEGGQLYMTSADAEISGSGISALYICGEAEVTDGYVTTSTGNQIEIGADGNMLIHNMTATRSYDDGIYNAGDLTIEDIEVSYHSENGIINRGTLVMNGGSVHDNESEGIYNRMGGTATLVSSSISIYNNHTGVVNHRDSEMELGYASIYDNSAYSISNYGELYVHDLTASNSGSTSIYGQSRGTMTMKNVTVNGTVTNHGIYAVGGSVINMSKVTIKNTEDKGIANKGGTISGSNVKVLNAGTDGVANVTVAGTINIRNLTVSGSGEYNLQNAGDGSVMTITGGTLGATTSHNVRNSRGTMTLTNVTIDGVYLASGSTSSVHGIYSTADYLYINNCTIKNVEDGRAIHNRGTTLVINGLTVDNVNGYAVANVLASSDWTGDGNVTISGLTIKNPLDSAILQETPGGTMTIMDSVLTAADTKNIIVNNRGTMMIGSGVDMTCTGRAINNKGTMIIDGGAIHDITPTNNTIGTAIYNVGDLTINYCEIYNNTATSKGVICNTTYTYDYNQDGTDETLCGKITVNGGKFYNNKVSGAKNNLYGGALFVDENTTAELLGGYFYNNNADGEGNDIYNAGTMTIGQMTVGYDSSGTAYSVDSMTGELYTTKKMYFTGTSFAHTSSKPLNITLEDRSLGTQVIEVASGMAKTVKAGVSITDLSSSYWLEYVNGCLTIWKENAQYVCRIGNTYYYSLTAAVADVAKNSSATIVILNDIDLVGTVSIDGNKTITLTDDGTQHVISRDTGLERFLRVYSGSSLTITSTSGVDDTPMLIFDGTTDNAAADSQFIYVNSGAEVTLNAGVVLQNNTTTSGGGAVNVASGGTFTMNGGLITGNAATGSNGGAFYVNGTVTINGGTISKNNGASGGGAFYVTKSGKLTITGGEISGNYTAQAGGAITLQASGASAAISGGTITGNTAASGGGAVEVLSGSTLTMSGGTISGNTCENNSNNNGIRSYADTSVVELSGTVFVDYINLNTDNNAITLTGTLSSTGKITLICGSGYSVGRVVVATGTYTSKESLEMFAMGNASYILEFDESNKTGILAKEKEARNLTTGVEYESLAEAVDAVADGGTATLEILSDISLTDVVEIGSNSTAKNITIIDNSSVHTVSRASGYTGRFFRVYSGSSLMITTTTQTDDNPMLIFDGSSTSSMSNAQFVYSAGELTIDAGVVMKNNSITAGGAAINAASGSNVTINDGLYTGNSTTNSGVIYIANGAKVTMTGGTITGNSSSIGAGAVDIIGGSNKSTFIMSGGTISGNTGSNGENGVRIKAATSIFQISGSAYADVISLYVADDSCAVELVGDLSGTGTMSIFCVTGCSEGRVVIKSGTYTTSANVERFALSDASYLLTINNDAAVITANN